VQRAAEGITGQLGGRVMSLRYQRASEQRRVAWRNGAGLTTELASDPADSNATTDFRWRVSMAEVTTDCEFSLFPDVDRMILLVEGASMSLQLSGVEHDLTPFEPFHFDGAAQVRCRVSGPTRDLNIMTRRDRATATVSVEHATDEQPPLMLPKADPLVIVCLDGTVTIQTAHASLAMHAGDVLEHDEPLLASGDGRIAVVRVEHPGHQAQRRTHTGMETRMNDKAEQATTHRLVAQTGWAANQCRRHDGMECYHCGLPLDVCEGCGQRRCLACEPYMSDDCRWVL
jgi:environmental stress-induced protein Ves